MKKWFVVCFLFVITLFQSLQTVSAETVEWKERADLPEPRVGASSGVVDGKIYVIGGGTVKSGTYGNQTFVYDPKTNEWTRKADMPTARGSCISYCRWENLCLGRNVKRWSCQHNRSI